MLADRARSVLIVEDERIVAKDLQQTLAGMGYDPFAIASSAEEAVARASERCPDVVLMDIRIKGRRDGVETAEILRQRFRVPVVYLTALADDGTIDRAKKTEPYGYLLKPVNSAALRSAIELSLYKHEMEKRLRERERWFSTTLRSVADAVITVDLAGNVSFMNPVAEQLTGVKLRDALGRPARAIVRLDPTQSSPLDQALEQGKTTQLQESELENGTGTNRIISDSAAPVVDEGQLLGAVMVFRDVTEQKLLQKKLELSDRLASLGTMAAGVAHELNNPLAVVVANAWLVGEEMTRLLSELREGHVPSTETMHRLEEAVVAQSELQASASRAGRIVSDLKTFIRPAPQTQGEADVGRSIVWAIEATSHELRHRARIVTEAGDVPPVAIDEMKLGQLLVNLLLNAAHAISPGNVDANTVSVTARPAADGGVVIEVRDTGCGMAPEVLKRVFEPFFTTKPVGTGTGLGLSICHGIVASAGGDLRVESRVGEGSVFRVVLPVVRKETWAAPSAAVEPATDRCGRLLVIDDEETVLRAIRRILKQHDVVGTERAREALGLLEGGKSFDIIFSDLMMPDMTGMAFYEELLRTRPEDAARVVFLTGGAITAEIADFLATVPNLRLEKPFGVVALRATVQQILSARPQA